MRFPEGGNPAVVLEDSLVSAELRMWFSLCCPADFSLLRGAVPSAGLRTAR